MCIHVQVDSDPGHPRYIATQGPLQETVGDFWQVSEFKKGSTGMTLCVCVCVRQMVWEQNVTVIVMLTTLYDMGMVSATLSVVQL